MSGYWGSKAGSSLSTTTARLEDIMSEQVIAKEYGDWPSLGEQEKEVTNIELSDYELALRLQHEEDQADIATDREIASYWQAVEDHEEQRLGRAATKLDSLVHSKINTRTALEMAIYEESDNARVSSTSYISSSGFAEAVLQDRRVEHLSDDQYQHLVRHDALLGALSASRNLSELHGVGDLTAQGLVVNKAVAQPVMTFLQRQEQTPRISTKQQRKKQ